MDLVTDLTGNETFRLGYWGCPADGAVELWTMVGASHVPNLARPGFANAVVGWLRTHGRL
jgi:hypothetical protein